MRPLVRRGGAAVALLAALATLVACGGPDTVPAPSAPATGPSTTASPSPGASASGAGTASATAATPSGSPTAAAEPTTTNTLPPPPPPTGPAPSTAGELTAASLPVPKGWRTVALDGGEEEGFEGNGTWVHERDPRYAAADVIGVGCAPVTRDDYADPVAALEGNYAGPGRLPGVGLAMQFADATAATRYFTLYRQQVEACTQAGGPVQTTLIEGVDGLADHRRYDDGDWTEVGRQAGDRVVLVVLADPGHKISRAAAQAILDQIR
jgi:hypothetical protein